ncbi:response regulator transcription factor [Clostridium estertheticum]|uniref:response regulator transcription factor n=2 Tax=Clostridium estertheticum TaxID=238834 RepID=UPI0039A759E7
MKYINSMDISGKLKTNAKKSTNLLGMIDIIKNKVLIIDDEEAILILLSAVLKKEGFVNVKTINNSIDSIPLCNRYEPDIIILDIMMPNMDGFDVLREIRKFTIVPVLFLSAKSEETDKLLGLGMGADDYITKPFSPKEVAFRIKAHLRRIELIKKSLNKRKDIIVTKDFTIDFEEGNIKRGDKIYKLRAKEISFLRVLVENANTILSKKQIIRNVWEDTFCGYDNTIMVHVRKLREKLEEDPSDPKYLVTIKGLGYKFNLIKGSNINS